jgi:hypothetical protein
LSETTGLFELTAVFVDGRQGWFDLSLSFLVGLTPFLRSQRTGHPLLRCERFRDAAARDRRQFFMMFQSLRRNVRNPAV